MMSFLQKYSSSRSLAKLGVAGCFVFVSFYNLSDYPTTWFDEGVHLHVPQTLVRYGEYADRSSDGFRYFGPTIGVGPTVMLPIAAVYKLFGIGLLQARIVMALFLLGAMYLFYRLARSLGGPLLAAVALVLLVSSPAVALLETGRQVLGEVPGFFFLLAGLIVWFSAWDRSWGHLTLAGLLFGAAAVTKYQNLILLVPTIALAAGANLLYYKTTRLRIFLWPGMVLGTVFGVWQLILVVYLGPQTSAENFAALREATAGAAAVFSPDSMKRALRELLSFRSYGSALALALPYGVFCALPRSRSGQRWGILLLFVVVNLVWYAVASIGWPRYAFTGLALASLFVAKVFLDLLQWLALSARAATTRDDGHDGTTLGLRAALTVWGGFILITSLAATLRPIVSPPENYPAAMSAFLDREVPKEAVIETWEQELGALTTHNYHYPPARLLIVAVRHIWLHGPGPAEHYRPIETDRPPYVVVGGFGRWVGVYPTELLEKEYSLDARIGGYELYRRIDQRGVVPPIPSKSAVTLVEPSAKPTPVEAESRCAVRRSANPKGCSRS
jgi:hypothetical protein